LGGRSTQPSMQPLGEHACATLGSCVNTPLNYLSKLYFFESILVLLDKPCKGLYTSFIPPKENINFESLEFHTLQQEDA
jgi:hypothetical protein